MSDRFRKFVLLVLLLLVPLQGLAAMAHALSCAQHGDQAAAASGHSHTSHDHGGSHHHPDGTGSGDDHSSHQCCHHFSAAPVSAAVTAPIELGLFQSTLTSFDVSAELERPQRPPRS